MSVPTEYTTAHSRLANFRNSILAELVGGRVKAGLDASHSGMQKYSSVIQSLSVTPYLFGEIQRKAIVLQLKGNTVGAGKIRQVRADYSLTEVEYPLQPPYSVPRRKLPQVDVFAYEALKDIELLDKTNIANLKSFVLAQTTSGFFADTPHIENAVYDYYEFIPQDKYRNGIVLTNPIGTYVKYHHVRGEYVCMYCELIEKGTLNKCIYIVDIIVDAVLYSDTNEELAVPVLFRNYAFLTPPDITYNVAGQRVPTGVKGVWACGGFSVPSQYGIPAVVSFGRVADDWDYEEPLGGRVWVNAFDVTMAVNDEEMGYTVPAVGTVTKVEATDSIDVVAYPNEGYEFLQWERNGIPVSNSSSMSYQVFRDTELKAVFARK